MGDRG
jgi:hypothetical protein